MKHAPWVILGAIVALSLFTGCAPDFENSEPGGDAILDYDKVNITLPIDKYRLSDEEQDTIQSSIDTAFQDCFSDFNINGLEPSINYSNEDRSYGLWNVELAKEYGYSISRRKDIVAPPHSGG